MIKAACCMAFILGSTIVGSAASAATSGLAPADEYFGKLKMSPIGVRNAITIVERRVANREIDVAQAESGLALIEDCLHDWEGHYPRDPWIPRMLYAVDHVYREFASSDGTRLESRCFAWMQNRYARAPETLRLVRERGTPSEDSTDLANAGEALKTDPVPESLRPER